MRAEALEKLVNKPVKDIYGRYVGFVVGFSVDTSGELKSVGVDQGNGEFTEYASQRIVSAADGFIVIPSWKVDCEMLGKEIDAVRRRAKALQDLAHDGEVPRPLFEEMIGKYNEEASKIKETYGSLGESMAVRIGELEEQKENLDRFLVNVKVQFRAGEIDESAYKVASECCQAMQKRNAQEQDELSKMLKSATAPLTSGMSAQATAAQAPVQPIAQTVTE
jgi:hypothetical protein